MRLTEPRGALNPNGEFISTLMEEKQYDLD